MSTWVLIDAKTVSAKRAQILGMGNMGTVELVFVRLLLWIIAFRAALRGVLSASWGIGAEGA